MISKNSLGCGKRFKIFNGKYKEVLKDCDFICGVADGWGKERLCLICKIKLKEKWDEKDILKKLEGGEK